MVSVSNGGIIYVSMQYRLGIFGFLGGAEIADNGVRNAGLLDQRSALDWIQRKDGLSLVVVRGSLTCLERRQHSSFRWRYDRNFPIVAL